MSKLRVFTTIAIEASELTAQLKRMVPTVSGIDVLEDGLAVRRLAGDFTPAEEGLLQAVVSSHDAAAIRQVRADREQTVNAERGKKPSTLTPLERIHRIELILGLD